MSLRPRKGQLDDARRLERLERALYSGDIETAESWRYHLNKGHEVWLLEDGKGLVASVLLIPARTNIRIEGLAVAKRAQGKGYGRQLLRFAEMRAKKHGKTRLTLEVRPDNVRAQAVYKSHGFQRIGTRRGFYEDGADAYRMAKVLE